MTVVREDMDLPGQRAPLATVKIELAGEGCLPYSPAYNAPNQTLIGALRLKPGHGIAPNGYWEVDLVPNALINPPGTAYRIERTTSDGDVSWSCISVPVSGGPYSVSDLLTDPPGTVTSPALQNHIDTLHIPHVVVPAAWGEWWRLARAEAADRVVRVQVWGDSISVAGGATSLDLGWTEIMMRELQATYGDGGSGYIPWSMPPRSGTWTVDIGFGGGLGTIAAAGSISYTGLRGTEIRFWFKNLEITGSFRWRVDGGSYTTVTPPVGFLPQDAVTITELAPGAHTLDIERVSGTIGIYGAEARYDTGVIVQRCAQGGRAMSDYSPIPLERVTVNSNGTTTITSTAPGVFTSSHINRYISSATIFPDSRITAVASATSATISRAAAGTATNLATISVNPGNRGAVSQETTQPAFGLLEGLHVPDVVIIMLGANDGGNPEASDVSWLDGAANILRPMTLGGTLTYSPEVIVVIEHYGNWIASAHNDIPAITAMHASVAEGNGGALVDIWGMGRRSWAYWNNLGYFADTIHPSDAGHEQYARPIIDLLTR